MDGRLIGNSVKERHKAARAATNKIRSCARIENNLLRFIVEWHSIVGRCALNAGKVDGIRPICTIFWLPAYPKQLYARRSAKYL